MVVGIKVVAENVKERVVRHTNTCYFTMVAKDDDEKPSQVPELILESEDEVRRFIEAIVRKYMKNTFRDEMQHVKDDFDLKNEVKKLEDERCVIRIEDL